MIPLRTSIEVRETPALVVGLIAANVAVFAVQLALDPGEPFVRHAALVPARYTVPGYGGAAGLGASDFLPFLTNAFMHAGWWHLIVNMWTLWLFGPPLEQRLGALRLAVLYLTCAVLASASHFAFNLHSTVPALGASGAIAGVLGAFTLVYTRARVTVITPVLFFPMVFRVPAIVFTGLWFALQLARALAEIFDPPPAGGIAWWAHIGGFVAGAVLVGVLGRPRRRPRDIGPQRPVVLEVGAQISGARTIGERRPGRRSMARTMRREAGPTVQRRRAAETAPAATQAWPAEESFAGAAERRAAPTTSPWQDGDETDASGALDAAFSPEASGRRGGSRIPNVGGG